MTLQSSLRVLNQKSSRLPMRAYKLCSTGCWPWTSCRLCKNLIRLVAITVSRDALSVVAQIKFTLCHVHWKCVKQHTATCYADYAFAWLSNKAFS